MKVRNHLFSPLYIFVVQLSSCYCCLLQIFINAVNRYLCHVKWLSCRNRHGMLNMNTTGVLSGVGSTHTTRIHDMQKKPDNLNVSDTLLLHVEEAK
jgi:hypothetical protein